MKVRCHGAAVDREARIPTGSSAVRIDLHAPGISLQCDRMRKSSRSCPCGSASFVESDSRERGDTPEQKRNKTPPYMAQTTAWSRRCW